MNISLYTLGCKVNQYESQSIAELFLKLGYNVVPNSSPADVFIINSCTVTAESDRKTRQMLRRFRKKNPNAVLVLAGCMPQAFPRKAENLYEADIIVGNTAPDTIPELVEQFKKSGERIIKIGEHTRDEKFNTPTIENFGEHTRAFMKIEDGCDRYCTYCIIPKARGFIRSKAIEDIEAEAKALANSGYREIVLVGINLSSFGKDNGSTLAQAVEAASKPAEIARVRLGSLEPDLMDDKLLDSLADNPKFCPQFHLSLQSGCDTTLKRMNRRYDSAFYMDLVTGIRSKFSNAAITTDIMVGFAGEDEQEFSHSLEFVKKVGFAKAHIFAYSRRAGTFADKYLFQVENAVKEERSRKMTEATAISEQAFLKDCIGKEFGVLFETNDGELYSGYTENYTLVKVYSDKDLRGQILRVKCKCVKNDYIIGEIV